jgi:hypothetical protein
MIPTGRQLRRWFLALLLTGLSGCSGAMGPSVPTPGDNELGPPAPPIEVPLALRLPDSIRINLDTVSPAGTAALKAQVAAGGEFSDEITSTTDFITDTDAFLEGLLNPIAALEIPISPDVRTFASTIHFESGDVGVKIDFADFDLDGNGTTEACSGCTCPLGCAPDQSSCPATIPAADAKPVCYRVWITPPAGSGISAEHIRYMAGRIDRFFIPEDSVTAATERRVGKGEFFVGLDPTAEGRNSIHARYDQDAPLDSLLKTNEIFWILENFDSGGTKRVSLREHATVDQKPIDASGDPERVAKTINLSVDDFIPLPFLGFDSETPDPVDAFFKARFREDLNFWSGSRRLLPDPKGLSFENACAFINSGNASPRINCQDGKIDVEDLPDLDLVQDSDVNFPADFPPLPTF